jgi:outer membrane lipoprotein-sorting protein
MVRIGLGRLSSRRWFAAGLCMITPLVLVGAGGWLGPSHSDSRLARAVLAPRAVDHHEAATRAETGAALQDGPASIESAKGTVQSTWVVADVSRHAQPNVPASPPTLAPADPIAEAQALIAACAERYQDVRDYTCHFTKRERLKNGRLADPQVMEMKARSTPLSIYFRFRRPHEGREAIWVDGSNDDKLIVHDVGLGKFLAGTLRLDPTSRMAMADNRHPINEAGIGFLIEQVRAGWASEMKAGETEVTISRSARVEDRPCTLVESKHTRIDPGFRYHKIKVYIDNEHMLPIRFEAYDWPREDGAEADLLEEYTYQDLQLNVGLSEIDFSPENESYAFGRF